MKKEEDLISIVVPVYNVVNYLEECLNSLLSQKYAHKEIIVVDDGSTDGSSRICDEYAEKYDCIQLIRQENAGLSAARNTGLMAAKGKYICFVDSDDYVLPGYINKMYKALIKNGSDICVCGYDNFIPPEMSLIGSEATIRLLTQQINMDILAWNKMYKRSLFIDYEIRYPEGEIHEDNLTTYKLYSHAKRVSYIQETLYHYRSRGNSIMKRTKVIKHLQMRERAAREAQKYFAKDVVLKQAADISLLTAKFAYLDKSISGLVEEKYIEEAKDWILDHRDQYKKNIFMGKKLKAYYTLLAKLDGKPYVAFRKIKHE